MMPRLAPTHRALLPLALLALGCAACAINARPGGSAAPVLDRQALLERETFWSNRDFDWFRANIPFFDSPDPEINTTYYYRWELVTRHITYGSPDTGYLFTEFANRPTWSGAYGAISCPSGHQFNEVRWLHDPRYARDYLRYWFRTPGAQPRNYSSWLADSGWELHRVHPSEAFLLDLFPDLEANFEAWRERQWVDEAGLFWQLGHDDGMEFDINARQTTNILRGAPSLRPSFNSYMWAEAHALARIAELAGQPAQAAAYRELADGVKAQLQARLWDPGRDFFFPMSTRRVEDADGHVVEPFTLTYQTGRFAGSPHGRELHGYVPWAFNLPDPGFEEAWRFLMDPAFFYAEYGPTTVERHDPLFLLRPTCCWWSGQSWPFATTQTLKAMANLLQYYEQDHVTRDDYARLLHIFARSHRKDGRPWIAEALHPDMGLWDGHDYRGRSEHYFHSGFVDLVITGLAGIQPGDDDALVVHPLAPDSWDYFALDQLPYRGHTVAVVWDRTGKRYGRGAGLQVLVNGQRAARSPELGRLEVRLPRAVETPLHDRDRFNYVVNNDGHYFPRLGASHVGSGSALAQVQDGQFRYDLEPPNRWTAAGSGRDSDWLALDLGQPRPLDTVRLFLVDEGDGVAAPVRFDLEYHDGTAWRDVPGQRRTPEAPAGGRPNVISFPLLETRQLRVVFHHGSDGAAGVTELEAWGPGTRPYQPAPPPAGNLAFNPGDRDFPRASASHSDRFGGVPERAIDGRIVYLPHPSNRWTSHESLNETDWLEVDLGEERQVGRVVLHIYDDRGGVRPPRRYEVEYWTGEVWSPVRGQVNDPAAPTGQMANTATFEPISTRRVRVVFTHALPAKSGITELEIWADGSGP
jgi:hypothetical protein